MRRLKKKIQAEFLRLSEPLRSNSGMEMVQVAILVAIAIALGLIFKSEITSFVNKTFKNLSTGF